MVDVFFCCSGKIGVVLVIFGFGVINIVIGIVIVYMDLIFLVIIIGQVQSDWIGNDVFQEIDIVGVIWLIVKYSFMVKKIEDIFEIIKKVFYIVVIGCFGLVLVDIFKDFISLVVIYDYSYLMKVKMCLYNVVNKGYFGQIKKVVDLLLVSKCFVFYIGGGVIQGNLLDLFIILICKLGFFCINMLMGLGVFFGDDFQFLGMLGMYGIYEVNMVMYYVDFVLVIGVCFDDWVINSEFKFCFNVKIVYVDVDFVFIVKNILVDVLIVGLVDQVLMEMLDQLEKVE